MNHQPEKPKAVEHSVARVLFSHHPPEHICRTLTVAWGRHRYHVCARCSGVVLGAIVFGVLWGAGVRIEAGPFCVPLVLVFVLPGVVDFNRQLVGLKESTNGRRVITGAMFGFGLAWSVVGCAEGQWMGLAITVLVIGGYFAWLVLSRRRLVRLLRHLRMYGEYYERCRAEDVRRAASKRIRRICNKGV